MKLLDLCSGIGGFSLAARWVGWQTVAFCEIDAWCRGKLAKNFPDIPIFEDIRDVTAESIRERGIAFPDIIVGGIPCQPYSVAGKQQGDADDRALWSEAFRIIKDLKPRWVVIENVSGFISMALDGCISDLEGEGYEARAFVLPACAVNAPHRRDRVWLVANANRIGSGASWSGKVEARSTVATFTAGEQSATSPASPHFPNGRLRRGRRGAAVAPAGSEITPNADSPERRALSEGRDDRDGDDIRRQEAASGFGILREERVTTDTASDRFDGCAGQDRQQDGRESQQSGVDVERSGAPTADTAPARLQGNDAAGHTRAAGCATERGSASAGNASSPRLSDGRIAQVRESRQEQEPERPDGRQTLRGFRRLDDGLSKRLAGLDELPSWYGGGWEMPAPTNDGEKERVNKLKAYGNAVVPELVYEIFKAIDLVDADA